MTGPKTQFVGRLELTEMLAAAGLTSADWVAIAPPAVIMWPGAPKWKRTTVNNILRAARAARAETNNTEYHHD